MNQKEQLKLAGEQIDELFKINEDLIKKLATNTIYFFWELFVSLQSIYLQGFSFHSQHLVDHRY